jgi:hypothetical protein
MTQTNEIEKRPLPSVRRYGCGCAARAKEAIALYVETLTAHHEPIPCEAETARVEIA